MRKPIILDDSTCSNEPNKLGSTKMMSIYRMSDAQPDWSENDPSQPDYIANKDLAEKLRPLYVDGQLVLDSSHESGALCLISGDNVRLEVTEDKSIKIHSTGSGGEDPGGPCDCPDFVEGDGIILSEVETSGHRQTKSISLDVDYINKELILPALSGMNNKIADNTNKINELEETVTELVGEDLGKTIRQIVEEVAPSFSEEAIIQIATQTAESKANDVATNTATTIAAEKAEEVAQQVAQREIADWVQNSNIATIIDIEEPISVYVDKRIDEKIVDIGGGESIPVATTEILGGVKIDGETIKMNEKQQLYIAKMSTDDLVQGENTLVLDGGNDL